MLGLNLQRVWPANTAAGYVIGKYLIASVIGGPEKVGREVVVPVFWTCVLDRGGRSANYKAVRCLTAQLRRLHKARHV